MRWARLQALGIVVLLFATLTVWNVVSFDRMSEVRRRYHASIVAIPKPEVVKILALGYRNVIADWYWIKGVNYFGDNRNAILAYGELYNYLKLVVELDRKFYAAYLYGGYALPWNRGDKWVNVDEAAELLNRGIKEFPDAWKLRLQLAYIDSAYLHRFREAGDQLAAASKIPGAPRYAASLATRMYATVGDLQGAQFLAEEMIQEQRDPKIREMLIRRLFELRAADAAQRLTHAVSAYADAHGGKRPDSLSQLADSGVSIPKEPLGGSWLYDPKEGVVRSSVLNERLTLYVHPAEHSKAQNDTHDTQ